MILKITLMNFRGQPLLDISASKSQKLDSPRPRLVVLGVGWVGGGKGIEGC